MKILSSIVVATLIVVSFTQCKSSTSTNTLPLPVLSSEDNKIITQREISAWEFGKTKNFAGLKEIYSDDYTAFFGKNVMNENDVIKSFQNSIVRYYHLSNIRIKPVTNDVAIIYYDLEQDVIDENGDKWTPYVASSSTYVKRNGVWRSVFYQETEIKN